MADAVTFGVRVMSLSDLAVRNAKPKAKAYSWATGRVVPARAAERRALLANGLPLQRQAKNTPFGSIRL